MKPKKEFTVDKELLNVLSCFLKYHSKSDLRQALELYEKKTTEYICRTKNGIYKFYISDIDYIDIQKHTITFHVKQETFQKYGTLTNELNTLSPYGFIQCNQSYLVPLDKIKSIYHNDITLSDNTKIHMSRIYAPKVISAFLSNNRT